MLGWPASRTMAAPSATVLMKLHLVPVERFDGDDDAVSRGDGSQAPEQADELAAGLGPVETVGNRAGAGAAEDDGRDADLPGLPESGLGVGGDLVGPGVRADGLERARQEAVAGRDRQRRARGGLGLFPELALGPVGDEKPLDRLFDVIAAGALHGGGVADRRADAEPRGERRGRAGDGAAGRRRRTSQKQEEERHLLRTHRLPRDGSGRIIGSTAGRCKEARAAGRR